MYHYGIPTHFAAHTLVYLVHIRKHLELSNEETPGAALLLKETSLSRQCYSEHRNKEIHGNGST